ncbi:molybdopterin molybdotransferase [Candidatus Methanophagaceae archaeon]|nr:molybdopterin molybdotransferase [Methanophagales archaeon]KAF5436070.1 molybdopterin molybdotransferase [Methanophagales archaeon]
MSNASPNIILCPSFSNFTILHLKVISYNITISKDITLNIFGYKVRNVNKMKLFRTLISWDNALKTVLAHAKSTEKETVHFDESVDRILAEDIRSPIDSPPFDRAAMDGYAIKGQNSFGATPNNTVLLKRTELAGESAKDVEICEGGYLPIQTGQPMPKGSNAVVMLEYTKESATKMEIYKPVTPGKNVSLKGEDVKKGERVLQEGKVLRAHDLGMLAALVKTRVNVYKRMKVGIFSTGDELYDPKNLAETGKKIADVNSYVLEALVKRIANPYRIGIFRDDYEKIKDAITTSLTLYDALLISGGSSVGKKDFIADAVGDLGELLFHGVAIRPGEPTGFGIINNKPVFVLPGYPVATISAFEMLVRPFLCAAHGVKEDSRKLFAVTRKKIPSAVGRSDFVRVKLVCSEDEFYADPIRVSGSGILSSMTKSDGFVIIAENREGMEEGEKVEVNVWV